MSRVRVLIATGCHLCPPAVALVEEVCARHGISPEIVDIDGDVALERRYREAIPVVEVDGAEVARFVLDAAVLESALRGDGQTFVRSL